MEKELVHRGAKFLGFDFCWFHFSYVWMLSTLAME
jgi:hypothetical protein